MTEAAFQVVVLEKRHDCTRFNSGSAALDLYFREQVSQDIRRRVSACFVALAAHDQSAGFYTLASASLWLAELPAAQRKKLPRYPTVPAVRMGCLAVDQAFKGCGLGAALLADALMRTLKSDIAAYALRVCLGGGRQGRRRRCVLPTSWLHPATRARIAPVFTARDRSRFRIDVGSIALISSKQLLTKDSLASGAPSPLMSCIRTCRRIWSPCICVRP